MLDWAKALKQKISHPFANSVYSQEGEDLILDRYLNQVSNGFYIDIGAHHPRRFSNSYLFYLRGWNGLCVDANPDSMSYFKKIRPRDICIESGVSDQEGTLDYYVFDEKALNTFSSEKAEQILKETHYKLVRKVNIPVVTLDSILKKHMPTGKKINFLSIDIEGLDLKVLRSMNWKEYNPDFVVVEDNHFKASDPDRSEIHRLMKSQGYELISKLYNSLIYRSC